MANFQIDRDIQTTFQMYDSLVQTKFNECQKKCPDNKDLCIWFSLVNQWSAIAFAFTILLNLTLHRFPLT